MAGRGDGCRMTFWLLLVLLRVVEAALVDDDLPAAYQCNGTNAVAVLRSSSILNGYPLPPLLSLYNQEMWIAFLKESELLFAVCLPSQQASTGQKLRCLCDTAGRLER